MTDFYRTRMGKRHYQVVMPSIARALESIAGSLERISTPLYKIDVEDLESVDGVEDAQALKDFMESDKGKAVLSKQQPAISAAQIQGQVAAELAAMAREGQSMDDAPREKPRIELIGPLECSGCGGHIQLDATYIAQVDEPLVCPYCKQEIDMSYFDEEEEGDGSSET